MAIGELLQLLRVLCPPESRLPTSFYKLKKNFQMFAQDHVHQKICLKCKGSDCSCSQVPPDSTAHLVTLEVGKPLETIISSKLYLI